MMKFLSGVPGFACVCMLILSGLTGTLYGLEKARRTTAEQELKDAKVAIRDRMDALTLCRGSVEVYKNEADIRSQLAVEAMERVKPIIFGMADEMSKIRAIEKPKSGDLCEAARRSFDEELTRTRSN